MPQPTTAALGGGRFVHSSRAAGSCARVGAVGVGQGNAALKELQKQIRVEDVERLMDDVAATRDTLEDVNALLNENLSAVDEQVCVSSLPCAAPYTRQPLCYALSRVHCEEPRVSSAPGGRKRERVA